MARTRSLYDTYRNMMDSCYNEKCILYHSFGGKGIKVCPEWHNRDAFYEWCRNNDWAVGMRVTRKDSTKDFDPDNCYLAEQSCRKSAKILPKDLAYAAFGDKITNHPVYDNYCGMKQRCYNPKHREYPLYGGRGITICPEWLGKYGAIKFIIWSLENGFEDGLTIDRMDNDRGYSPDNCRWVDPTVQSKNRRNIEQYEYKNKLMNLSEIASESGISRDRLEHYVKDNNMDVKDAIEMIRTKDKEEEKRKYIKNIEYNRKYNENLRKEYEKIEDETIYFLTGKVNFSAVGRKYGIPPYSVKRLVDKGMSLEEAIETVRAAWPNA